MGAPTNEAFDNLPPGTVDALLEDIPALSSILLFHAIPGKVYSTDLVCTGVTTMVNGLDSRTVCEGGAIFQKGAGNKDCTMPEIFMTDIKACNGVIHVVSKVM